jgi:membrane peptidoglycan carboxypeptidase
VIVPFDYPRAGRAGWRRFLPSWRQSLLIAVTGALGLVIAFFVAVAVVRVPQPSDVASAQATIVYWSDGRHELGRIGAANRIDVKLSDIPLPVRQAVLAAEDRTFYQHGGFSVPGLGRALLNDIAGGPVQGGSTITQQYIKNAFLTQQRSIGRKLKELVLAVKLETTVSKDQILENYLNTIYFGRGAYGIETAAQAYFGVHASQLTTSQGAALAAIIRSPGGYAPDRHLTKLSGRWNYVVNGMEVKGWLTPQQRAALVFPKFLGRRNSATGGSGTIGYLLSAVHEELLRRGWSEDDLNRLGLHVVSTFEQTAQSAALKAVAAQAPTSGTKGLRIGLVSIRPLTGEVVAMYGGSDYTKDPLNNATQAIGPAGSTFKPFALAAATEAGGYPLSSMWDGSSPRTIDGYTVHNFNGESFGHISLLTATENSVNSVFVDLSFHVGYDKVYDAAKRAGMPVATSGFHAGRTLVLGTASPHPIDMAAAYATFAGRGQQVAPTTIKMIESASGQVYFRNFPVVTQAFSTDVADTVTTALQAVVANGTGIAAQGVGRPVAGKTGTTDNNRSAWFVGYTPQLATAVMLVKDGPTGRPTSLAGTGGLTTVTGGSFPAQIWTAFMRAALANLPVVPFGPPVSTLPSPSASRSATSSPTPKPTVTTSKTPSPTPTPTPTVTSKPTPTGTPTPSSSAAVP